MAEGSKSFWPGHALRRPAGAERHAGRSSTRRWRPGFGGETMRAGRFEGSANCTRLSLGLRGMAQAILQQQRSGSGAVAAGARRRKQAIKTTSAAASLGVQLGQALAQKGIDARAWRAAGAAASAAQTPGVGFALWPAALAAAQAAVEAHFVRGGRRLRCAARLQPRHPAPRPGNGAAGAAGEPAALDAWRLCGPEWGAAAGPWSGRGRRRHLPSAPEHGGRGGISGPSLQKWFNDHGDKMVKSLKAQTRRGAVFT